MVCGEPYQSPAELGARLVTAAPDRPDTATEVDECTCGEFAGTSVRYADCPVHCPAPAAGGGDTRDGREALGGGPWTRHGHPIPGVTVFPTPPDKPRRPPVARCGGVSWCSQCQEDAAALTPPARPAAAPADDTGELREAIRDVLIDRYGEQPVRDRDAWLPDADAVLALPAVRALIDGARTDRATITAVQALAAEAESKGSALQGIPEMRLVGNAYTGMADRIRRVLGGER